MVVCGIVTKRNVLLLSFGLAFVTSLLVYRFLQQQTPTHPKMAEVVYARHTIGLRQVIKRGDVYVASVPQGQVHGSVCGQLIDVVGKIALTEIAADDPISPDDIGKPVGLSLLIPPGMRAMTVGVDPVSGVAGFLLPGDHVDVIAAFHGPRTLAQTVLRNVELVAMGDELRPERVSRNSGAAELKKTATLLVTPAQAEQLMVADNDGKLRLVLRSPDDQAKTDTPGARGPVMVASAPPTPVAAPSARPSNPSTAKEVTGSDDRPGKLVQEGLEDAQERSDTENGKDDKQREKKHIIDVYRGSSKSSEEVRE